MKRENEDKKLIKRINKCFMVNEFITKSPIFGEPYFFRYGIYCHNPMRDARYEKLQKLEIIDEKGVIKIKCGEESYNFKTFVKGILILSLALKADIEDLDFKFYKLKSKRKQNDLLVIEVDEICFAIAPIYEI